MKAVLRAAVPVGAAAATLLACVLLPAPTVYGDAAIGLRPPADAAPLRLGSAVRASWIDHHDRILLDVRSRADCRPRLLRVTSTAPARDEVDLRWPAGCAAGGPDRFGFVLPRPLVVQAGQQVKVDVDGREAIAPSYGV